MQDLIFHNRQKMLSTLHSGTSDSITDSNSESNSFSFKLKDYANSDLSKQKVLSKAITVGSVDIRTSLFILNVFPI